MEIRLDVLDNNQRGVLDEISVFKDYGFYLAGGTALTLQIGHRTSLDFDFYSEIQFDASKIYRIFQGRKNINLQLSQMAEGETLLFELNGISISLFFYPYPLIKPALKGVYFNLASLEDISAMKMIAIIRRGLKRDFADLFFLIKKFGLDEILSLSGQKFPGFNEYLALQSLTYFEDAETDSGSRDVRFLEPFRWEEAKDYIISSAEAVRRKWEQK